MKLQRRPSSPSCRLIDSLYHVGGPHRGAPCLASLSLRHKNISLQKTAQQPTAKARRATLRRADLAWVEIL